MSGWQHVWQCPCFTAAPGVSIDLHRGQRMNAKGKREA
jgi:hypothetical protein